MLNIKQTINKFHLPELPRAQLGPARPRLLLTGSLIDTVPNLAIVVATILGSPVYRLRNKTVADLVMEGALAYGRLSSASADRGEGGAGRNAVDLEGGREEEDKFELLARPELSLTKYYAGILEEYSRLKSLVERGVL